MSIGIVVKEGAKNEGFFLLEEKIRTNTCRHTPKSRRRGEGFLRVGVVRCLSITASVFSVDTTYGTFLLLVAKLKMALLLLLTYVRVNAVARSVAGRQTKSTAVPDDREGLQ